VPAFAPAVKVQEPAGVPKAVIVTWALEGAVAVTVNVEFTAKSEKVVTENVGLFSFRAVALTVAGVVALALALVPAIFVASALTVNWPEATSLKTMVVLEPHEEVSTLLEFTRYAQYFVISLPPVLAGAVHEVVTVVPLTSALIDVGTPGADGAE
jgi:hypothetical protein